MNSLHLHKICSDIMSVDIKDDFQSILHSLSTLLIINIISSHLHMECESVLFVTNYIPFLWSFNSFTSIQAVVFKLWNLLHVNICKMFSFCDVSYETKQKKNSNKLQRVCSLDWNYLQLLREAHSFPRV